MNGDGSKTEPAFAFRHCVPELASARGAICPDQRITGWQVSARLRKTLDACRRRLIDRASEAGRRTEMGRIRGIGIAGEKEQLVPLMLAEQAEGANFQNEPVDGDEGVGRSKRRPSVARVALAKPVVRKFSGLCVNIGRAGPIRLQCHPDQVIVESPIFQGETVLPQCIANDIARQTGPVQILVPLRAGCRFNSCLGHDRPFLRPTSARHRGHGRDRRGDRAGPGGPGVRCHRHWKDCGRG